MRLLVTGGAGFIGSCLIRMLLRDHPGYRIVNLDALTYAGNPENLAAVQGNPDYTFIQGDITDLETVEGIFREGIDAVVNTAAETHVDRSIGDPGVFVRSNVEGTRVLLDAARTFGVQKFVQVSTDEVYGSLGADGLFRETTPLAPSSPYSASKAAGDLLAMAYWTTYGLPVSVTRCSNNYGPFQFPEKLIPHMIVKALNDESLPVYGDGLNVRDWLHVDDHCRAIDLVLHRGRPGEVYNIGGNNERTNLDIVRHILRELGKPEGLITFVEDRPGHDRRYGIDAGKIFTELGWRPAVSLKEGLSATIRWYLEHPAWLERIESGAYRMGTQHKAP